MQDLNIIPNWETTDFNSYIYPNWDNTGNSNIDIITTDDTTEPSNSNVYSALKTQEMINAGIAAEIITSDSNKLPTDQNIYSALATKNLISNSGDSWVDYNDKMYTLVNDAPDRTFVVNNVEANTLSLPGIRKYYTFTENDIHIWHISPNNINITEDYNKITVAFIYNNNDYTCNAGNLYLHSSTQIGWYINDNMYCYYTNSNFVVYDRSIFESTRRIIPVELQYFTCNEYIGTTTITHIVDSLSNATDTQLPTAKAVYESSLLIISPEDSNTIIAKEESPPKTLNISVCDTSTLIARSGLKMFGCPRNGNTMNPGQGTLTNHPRVVNRYNVQNNKSDTISNASAKAFGFYNNDENWLVTSGAVIQLIQQYFWRLEPMNWYSDDNNVYQLCFPSIIPANKTTGNKQIIFQRLTVPELSIGYNTATGDSAFISYFDKGSVSDKDYAVPSSQAVRNLVSANAWINYDNNQYSLVADSDNRTFIIKHVSTNALTLPSTVKLNVELFGAMNVITPIVNNAYIAGEFTYNGRKITYETHSASSEDDTAINYILYAPDGAPTDFNAVWHKPGGMFEIQNNGMQILLDVYNNVTTAAYASSNVTINNALTDNDEFVNDNSHIMTSAAVKKYVDSSGGDSLVQYNTETKEYTLKNDANDRTLFANNIDTVTLTVNATNITQILTSMPTSPQDNQLLTSAAVKNYVDSSGGGLVTLNDNTYTLKGDDTNKTFEANNIVINTLGISHYVDNVEQYNLNVILNNTMYPQITPSGRDSTIKVTFNHNGTTVNFTFDSNKATLDNRVYSITDGDYTYRWDNVGDFWVGYDPEPATFMTIDVTSATTTVKPIINNISYTMSDSYNELVTAKAIKDYIDNTINPPNATTLAGDVCTQFANQRFEPLQSNVATVDEVNELRAQINELRVSIETLKSMIETNK